MRKTAAFVGMAAAIGYDYAHEAPRTGRSSSSPNPVLENVLGLLLCYDELYFPTPELCPADMRDLSYVHFFTDMDLLPDLIEAVISLETSSDIDEDVTDWPDFKIWSGQQELILEASEFERRIDNHTHGIEVDRGIYVMGNSMDPRSAALDFHLASLAPADRVDVILSTPAQRAINGRINWELLDSEYFNETKRSAAGQLAALRVPNVFLPKGSYHPALEELRDHARAREFRSYLSSLEVNGRDASRLANEVSERAFEEQTRIAERYLRGTGLVRSLALPAARGLLNAFMAPASGTLVGMLVEKVVSREDRNLRRNAAWAPFVVDLHRPA
ncbi:hypothetical protein [Georgenia yuyongxinii]